MRNVQMGARSERSLPESVGSSARLRNIGRWRLAGLLPKRRELVERGVLFIAWHVIWNNHPRQRASGPEVGHRTEVPCLVKSAGLQHPNGRHTLDRPPQARAAL